MVNQFNWLISNTLLLVVITFLFTSPVYGQRRETANVIQYNQSMTMANLITQISDMDDLNVIATENVSKKSVMVYTQGVSPREVLELVAEANEIKVLEKESGIIVLMTNDEYANGLGKSFDVRVYTLESVRVEDAQAIIAPALSSSGEVLINAPANQLVVLDKVQVLESIDSIIEEIDKDQNSQVIELKYLTAENAANLLSAVILPPGQISYSPNERFLIISDMPKRIAKAESLLKQMDKPKQLSSETFSLNYANCYEVGEAIRELFEVRENGSRGNYRQNMGNIGLSNQNSQANQNGSTVQSGLPRNTSSGQSVFALGTEGSVVMDERTNSVIVTADEVLINQIRTLVTSLDVKLPPHTYQFQHANFETLDLETKLSSILTSASERFQIDLDNTSVTFFAVPSKAEQVIELLETWDIKPIQVMIEAELLSVSNDTVKEIGMNFSARNDRAIDSEGNVLFDREGMINLAPLIAAGSAVSEISLGNLFTSDYNTILRAIITDSSTRIISQPSITTLNHQVATFSDIRREPYTVVSVEGETNTVLEDVNFENIGITLQVVPHVNELGDIRLQITLLLSNLVEIRNDIPVVAETRAEATSVMKNGQPVMLGGLELYEVANTKGRVPILSKIPILGLPFRGNKKDSTDRQLMLVVTPHIVDAPKQEEYELEILELHGIAFEEKNKK